jgi:tetratricopeptide (TPR) repeat protein
MRSSWKNWNKAESLLTAIDSDTSAYFLGEIAYRKGELPIAISHYSRIDRSSTYYHESQFKRSLIYLSLGDIKKTQEILDFLVKEDTDFADEAKEILRGI